MPYETDVLDLGPFAQLFLYSDGVFEIEQQNGKMWTSTEYEQFLSTTLTAGRLTDGSPPAAHARAVARQRRARRRLFDVADQASEAWPQLCSTKLRWLGGNRPALLTANLPLWTVSGALLSRTFSTIPRHCFS